MKDSNTQHFNHREVWKLAAPMILSNLSTPLVGLVDTAVVGHLPEPYHTSHRYNYVFLSVPFHQ